MQDATHLTLIIDRSGSMQAVKDDAEGAINAFFTEQRKVEGICTVHLWDFDAPRGVDYQDWLIKHFDGPLQNVPKYILKPRGSTALLDAVALTIKNTGHFLSLLPEDDRPDKVLIVIQTDGQENSSLEHTWEDVAALIKHQTDTYKWQFVFLGMGLDSFKQGDLLGIRNVVKGSASGIAHDHTHSILSANATRYRTNEVQDMSPMANVTVAADGKVFNAAGEELDPQTGTVIKA